MLFKEHNHLSRELDLRHPLTRGLVYAQESINPYQELAKGVRLIAPLAGVSHGVTQQGEATFFSGTQANNSTGVTSWNGMEGATEGTWELLAYFDVVTGNPKFFGQWDTSNRWLLSLVGSTLLWIPCETPARTRYDMSAAVPTPGWYHFVLSWRGKGNGVSVFVNGTSLTPGLISDGGVSITNTTNPIQIGGSGSAPMTGKVLFGRIWNRGLSDSECLSLSADPWQIYRPLQRSIWVPAAAAGGSESLAPDGNITQTDWTGGFAEIDETTPSDADFAYSTDNTAATLEVSLSNPAGTPGAGTTTYRYRIARTFGGVVDGAGNSLTVTASLYQGATLIESDTARTPDGTWTTYEFAPNTASVTDWDDLRLRFVTTASGGSPANRRGCGLSWAELEVPASGSISASISESGTLSDSQTASIIFAAARSESLSASDSQSVLGVLSGSISESLSTSESQGGGLVLQASDSESATASETQNSTISQDSTISESLSFADVMTAALIAVVGISESLAATDVLSTTYSTSALTSEIVAVSEVVDGSTGIDSVISEAIAAADSNSVAFTTQSSTSESSSAIENVTATYITVASRSESSSLSDTQDASQNGVSSGSVAEILTASESISAAASLLATTSETATASDLMTAALLMPASMSETSSLADTNDALFNAIASISEISLLADSQNSTFSITAITTETASISDVVSAIIGDPIVILYPHPTEIRMFTSSTGMRLWADKTEIR